MKNYRLVSPIHGVIDLDTLKNNANATSGVQVQSGATGLGLPPLEVQYQASAGDGAKFRSSRAAQRDIDFRLYLFAPNALLLGELVSRLGRALSGDLKLTCEGTPGADSFVGTWYMDVRHVGGGDPIMGKDTDHRSEMWMNITLRAGDPYWRAQSPIAFSNPVTPEVEWDGSLMDLITTSYDSVDTEVTVHGPAKGFHLKRFDAPGESFKYCFTYDNYIPPGESITVNFAEGSVLDQSGRSQFQHVPPGANLLPLKPGGAVTSEVIVPTAAEIAAPSARNYVVNPRFMNGFVSSMAQGWLGGTTHWGVGSGFGLIFEGTESTTQPGFAVTEISGLTVGKLYDLVVRVENVRRWSDYGVNYATNPYAVFIGGWGTTGQHAVTLPQGVGAFQEMRLTFRASSPTNNVTIVPSSAERMDGATTYYKCLPAIISSVSVIESGTPFFTGSNAASGGHTYNWEGTAHASRSRRLTAGSTATTRTSGLVLPKAKVLL